MRPSSVVQPEDPDCDVRSCSWLALRTLGLCCQLCQDVVTRVHLAPASLIHQQLERNLRRTASAVPLEPKHRWAMVHAEAAAPIGSMRSSNTQPWLRGATCPQKTTIGHLSCRQPKVGSFLGWSTFKTSQQVSTLCTNEAVNFFAS